MKGVGIIWTHNKFSQTLINFRFEVNLFIEKFAHTHILPIEIFKG